MTWVWICNGGIMRDPDLAMKQSLRSKKLAPRQ